jgi:hypothetical protein
VKGVFCLRFSMDGPLTGLFSLYNEDFHMLVQYFGRFLVSSFMDF